MSEYKALVKSVLTEGETSRRSGGGMEPTSIGQFLDLFIIHWIFAAMFVAGGIMLIDRFAANTAKPFSGWDDAFFSIGALALLLNTILLFAIPIAWLMNSRPTSINREEDHLIHALSILASGSSAIWGIIALIQTFRSTLTASVVDQVQMAGYFMVLINTVYATYLTIRHIMGLGGKSRPPESISRGLTAEDYLREINKTRTETSKTQAPPMSQNFFPPSSLFGGSLDLGALQSGSMSHAVRTVPANQSVPTQQVPCIMPMQYPMMMAYSTPQPPCSPPAEPTSVRL